MAFSVGPVGVTELAMSRNVRMVVEGIRAANSGVDLRNVAIWGRGLNPQSAVKGVKAIAISGLWFGSTYGRLQHNLTRHLHALYTTPLYIFGCSLCKRSAFALSGCVWILKAFSMARIFKRKGMLPSAASKSTMMSSPRSEGLAARCSDRVSLVSSSRDGDDGCVPIHS